jgi:hypothetical protein
LKQKKCSAVARCQHELNNNHWNYWIILSY